VTSLSVLLALGDTYLYLVKECGWEYELSSISPSPLSWKW